MKIDKVKFDIAKAKACIRTNDIINAGVPKGTVCRVTSGAEVRPETIGRIARILGCDVVEIIEK